MKKIKIKGNNFEILAELNSSITAKEIWKILPIRASANRWGDEIYFEIPIKLPEEEPKEVVNLGDLGYWPPGNAFCIFFGRTPISIKDEIRPASPVNIFGKLVDSFVPLKSVGSGQKIEILKAEGENNES